MKTFTTHSNDDHAQRHHQRSSRQSSRKSRRHEKLDARALVSLLQKHKTATVMAAAAITVLGAAWMAIELAG